MKRRIGATLGVFALLAYGLTPAIADAPEGQTRFDVTVQSVDDLKSVYATVHSKDLIAARVRTPGTVAALKIDEGVAVKPGQLIALVTDPKIALKIKALDAQIVATKSRIETTKTELDRAQTLRAKGIAPQSRVDQAQTAFDIATNDLKAAEAERGVVETQVDEGKVLAPAEGRVLRVPVTEGSVVMAGESIATIAANDYILRLEIPERHARSIKVGDTVRLGERGLSNAEAPLVQGKVTQVYPELSNGRVVADAEVAGLGSYYIGERVLVWISAGTRPAIVVPKRFVQKRYSLDYVRVAGKSDGAINDVIVQTGAEHGGVEAAIEILSGLTAGDQLVQP